MSRKAHQAAELAAYKTGALKSVDIEDEKDRYLRLAADFDNFKKRTARQYAEIADRANEYLIIELLGVIDDFERALATVSLEQSSGQTAGNRHFVTGMKLIYDKLMSVLKSRDVEPMDALGKQFDPVYHEAVMQSPSEKDEGTVIEIVSPGYLQKERVIRHAKVVVASSIV